MEAGHFGGGIRMTIQGTSGAKFQIDAVRRLMKAHILTLSLAPLDFLSLDRDALGALMHGGIGRHLSPE